MRCQASTKSRNVVLYFCASYGTLGKDNPSGCHCHRVKADLVHSVVESYLAEANKKIGLLLDAEKDNNFDPATKIAGEFYRLHEEMYDILSPCMPRLTTISPTRAAVSFSRAASQRPVDSDSPHDQIRPKTWAVLAGL